jgi:hypothetical protein
VTNLVQIRAQRRYCYNNYHLYGIYCHQVMWYAGTLRPVDPASLELPICTVGNGKENHFTRRAFRSHLVTHHASDLEHVRQADGSWSDQIVRITGARLEYQERRALLRNCRPNARKIIYRQLREQNSRPEQLNRPGSLLPASTSPISWDADCDLMTFMPELEPATESRANSLSVSTA